MATIHKVGDPENASETAAIRHLAEALPDSYRLVHNFELAAGQGLPYEYDLAVIGEHAVYHVEVKGYRGLIRGDRHQWAFENGAVYPSPIPLANKKSKILAGHLRARGAHLGDVFVETLVLLTDDRARAQLRDEQAHRVVLLKDAPARLQQAGALPVPTRPITALHDDLAEALLGTRPAKKPREIGLYRVLEKIGQGAHRVVYLAEHRYIRMRPKTVLKVFTLDPYASKEQREKRVRAIFHDQEALRLISGHPNILETGDFFAWDDDKFVLPTEYLEQGRPLEVLLDREEDKKISWAGKRRIVAGIARGLAHAHRGGVVHRDLRPLNVVVAPGDVAKLVNFDLARIARAGETPEPPPELRERLDPRYAAPEVWADPESASPASDVYSLGLLFYELVTGERPMPHVNYATKAGKVPFDLAKLRKELETPGSEDFMSNPGDVVETIQRMGAVNPAERPASMDEVLEDLELIGD